MTEIINCVGVNIKQELVKDMSQSPFNIMVNGSNDAGLEKCSSYASAYLTLIAIES